MERATNETKTAYIFFTTAETPMLYNGKEYELIDSYCIDIDGNFYRAYKLPAPAPHGSALVPEQLLIDAAALQSMGYKIVFLY